MRHVCLKFICGKETERVPGKWRQIFATLIVNLSSILCGLVYGWTASMIPLLREKDNEAGVEPLTDDQFSWAVSALTFGPLFILPFAGPFSEKFGRKTTTLCMTIPILSCWLIRLFATNFYHILFSQLLGGIFDGLSSACVPIYITESVSDSIRGQLGSYFLLTVKIGTLAAYILSTVISYKTYTIIALVLSVVYFLMLLIIPEAPVYLVRKRRIEEAQRSLMWLRGNDKIAVADELSRLQKFHNEQAEKRKTTNLLVLFKDRASWKGFLMGIGVIVGQQTCGLNVILTYTVTIFALTKTTVDPHIASISYGCSQVLGVCFSSLTVERLGRRKILFSSSTGMGLSHLTIGIFLLFQNAGYDISHFNWLPMVTISIFGFFYSSGMGPVTYILPNELYNPELASICSAVAMFILYTIAGTTIKLFPLLVEILGLHTCFFIFMLSCLYTFLFTFILPETKGKSMETIRKELSGELPKRPIKDPMQVVTKL